MKDEELLRYSRQILLPDIDVTGQEKIINSRVLIIGLGGLGSPVALYLAAAGVGELVLVDFDTVDLSNLQRQIAHTTDRIGQSKVESAKAQIQQLNPHTNVVCLSKQLSETELNEQVRNATAVVDCSDNFNTRFAINKACVKNKKPLISGAAIRLEGQISVFDSRQPTSPCYRCLYEDIDDSNLSCAQNGVLSSLVGIIGAIQATETLKVIAEFGEPLLGRLLLLDAKAMSWRELKLSKDSNCPVCGNASSKKS